MRENTERPEAVEAGTVRLIGTDEDRIVAEVTRLVEEPDAYAAMANAVNPYGDGRAAERSVAALLQLFGLGRRSDDFSTVDA
jgi:UDP-N-acetylglucosamine 2-epimerase (non-hydrolysing)